MSEWQPIETAPVGEVVMTKVDDGDGVRNVQSLVHSRSGHSLWFTPDRKMYVYYDPTHWRPLSLSEREKNHG